jgi:predicted DNA-binding transcriptional regulator YafY
MRRADRLFQLVQLLRARRFITAAELADALQVSQRTVYRDVRDLIASGVPIRGEAGVGYQLQRGYELPPMTFTTPELEALALGARMVESWGDPELAQAARSVLTKVEGVVPEPLRQVMLETALFAPTRRVAASFAERLGDIRRAVGERRKLRVQYVRRDGEPSDRVVRPLGLYFWGMSWSLAAWCELRGDFRNFRLDRIQDQEVLDAHFSDVNIEDFIASMEAGRPP